MQQVYTVNKILENTEIAEGIYKLSIEGDFDTIPGQFYMLRAWGLVPLLSRPISIYDKDEASISFLYEVRGEGTKLLSGLKAGDEIELLGPLGNGFDIENIKGKVAVIAGGIGVAPMNYLVKSLKNCKIDFYAGFRNQPYLMEAFHEHAEHVYLSTESGAFGHKGYVTDMLKPWDYDAVLCCGPEVMMKKVVELCKDRQTPVYISMERHMACGIGACLVCSCKTKKGNERVCKDGPVFSGRDVIWND